MSMVKNNMTYIMMIEDATKRIGDRLVPLLLSGELSVSDDYVNSQVSLIADMIDKMNAESSSEV